MSALRVYSPDECGADGYPFAWHMDAHPEEVCSIKDLVRQEAGHRCVRCGHPYEAGKGEWSPCDRRCRHGGPVSVFGQTWANPDYHADITSGEIHALAASRVEGAVRAQWRVLTVHHLTGEKADCRWWNLAALCQRCHLTIQHKVRMAQTWPWPHTDWFRPYAAGWYAWTYLGEEITRGEAVERTDELLALAGRVTGDQHGPLTREVHEAVERALDEHRRDMRRFGWVLAGYGPQAAWRWARSGELPEIPEGEL